MIGYCQHNDTPEPEFSEYSSGFGVTFRFKNPMNTAISAAVIDLKEYIPTPRQREIMKILASHNHISTNEIAQQLKDNPRPEPYTMTWQS